MASINLFTTQSGNGNSAAFKVTEYAGAISTESVLIQATGTWNSAELAVESCADPTASPQVWTSFIWFHDIESFETIECITGAAYRVALSGSGSPVPSISVTAVGDIELL